MELKGEMKSLSKNKHFDNIPDFSAFLQIDNLEVLC